MIIIIKYNLLDQRKWFKMFSITIILISFLNSDLHFRLYCYAPNMFCPIIRNISRARKLHVKYIFKTRNNSFVFEMPIIKRTNIYLFAEM